MSGEPITADVISTRPPPEVANPRAPNPFALDDGKAKENVEHMVRRLSVGDDVEKTGERRPSTVEREMYPEPTEDEARTLRKIADSIPIVAYSLCIVELAERASYYGVQTVFSNFMQYPLPKGGNGAGAPPRGTQETAGALGKGAQFANAIGLLFLFMAYIIPIFGGWVADTKLGRYKTILIGVLICGVSHIIMVCGAIPSVLQAAGHGIAPFMVSLWILAIGAGIFKPNIAPTILDQYRHQKPYTRVLKSGEKVVVDPEATVQRIMLIFYGMINVGAFFAIATTFSEKYVGYWLAFLTPGIVYFALPFLLWFLNNKLVKYPPDGSVLNKVAKIIALAIKTNPKRIFRRDFLDCAKPSELRDRGITTFRGKPIEWTNKDVEDLKRTVIACMIFLYYPIWLINDGGVGSLQAIQGSTMTTNGAPNDLLTNFNPLTIIVTIPILSHIVYPYLRRKNIKFGRITRITVGFTLAWISGIIGAIVQWKIYKTSPGGYYATDYAEKGLGVSPLSIWIQIPNVALGAISECFVNVTGYEMAYARSPPGMKAVVMAFFLFTTALSYALSEVLTPAIADPNLIWAWAAPAIALFVQTIIFWFRYRHVNDDEFMTYEDPLPKDALTAESDGDEDETVPPTEQEIKI